MTTAVGAHRATAATPLCTASAFVESVGVNTHFSQSATNYFKNTDRILSELGELKIKHLRDNAVFLSGMTRNHYAYTNYRRCAALGYRLSLVCFDPTNQFTYTPPTQVPQLYDWCDGAVAIFEGGNEPALIANPARNVLLSNDHQRQLYEVVSANKAAMPGVIVAAPSYIQQNIGLAMPLLDACDIGNVHPYAGQENPESTFSGSLPGYIAAVRRISGDKPVIASEIGYHTALQTTSTFMPVPEQARARYMPRTLLWAFLNRVKRSYIYEFASSVKNGPADKESNFGLLDNALMRTTTFEAVRSLMTLCTDGAAALPPLPSTEAPDVAFTQPAGVSLALSRPDGSVLMFAWHGVPAFLRRGDPVLPPANYPATLTGVGGATRIVAHRFRDNGRLDVTPLQPNPNGTAVTVSDQVTAFEISYR